MFELLFTFHLGIIFTKKKISFLYEWLIWYAFEQLVWCSVYTLSRGYPTWRGYEKPEIFPRLIKKKEKLKFGIFKVEVKHVPKHVNECQFWAKFNLLNILRKLKYEKFWLCWNKPHSWVCRTWHVILQTTYNLFLI